MRVLSIDGGGYLGLATAAFIAESERHLGFFFKDRFELFCGTSTGAILALALANGKTGKELVDLYSKLGENVFGHWSHFRNTLRFCRSLLWAKYSATGLRRDLDKEFGKTTLNDLCQRGKFALVTSYNLSAGRPKIFKTDHSPSLSQHGKLRLADIALASAWHRHISPSWS